MQEPHNENFCYNLIPENAMNSKNACDKQHALNLVVYR